MRVKLEKGDEVVSRSKGKQGRKRGRDDEQQTRLSFTVAETQHCRG